MNLLILQIDGLTKLSLELALRHGGLSSLRRRLDSGELNLHESRTGFPSDPCSFEASLLSGLELSLPGERWWDRQRQRTVEAARATPTHPAWPGLRIWGRLLEPPSWLSLRQRWATGMALASLDQAEGATYARLSGYASLATLHGPDAHPPTEFLASLNADLERLLDAADRSRTPCPVVLFSGAGIHPARPFRQTYGQSMASLIEGLLRSTSAAEPPLPVRPMVLATGNLAHVYLPIPTTRAPLNHASLEEHYPGLTHILRRHPGLALVACRDEDGATCVGTSQARASFLPTEEPPSKLGLPEQLPLPWLHRLVHHKDSGDLVLLGSRIEERLISFGEGKGCHGGHEGLQRETFVAASNGLRLEGLPSEHLAATLHPQLRGASASPTRHAFPEVH